MDDAGKALRRVSTHNKDSVNVLDMCVYVCIIHMCTYIHVRTIHIYNRCVCYTHSLYMHVCLSACMYVLCNIYIHFIYNGYAYMHTSEYLRFLSDLHKYSDFCENQVNS